jgi:uncharacterized protein (TIGR00290 family)
MKSHKTVFHWSGGKDSSIALYEVLKGNKFLVDTLLTTVNKKHDRVSMHGVRRKLIEKQAESIGLPFTTLDLPEQPGMDEYDQLMTEKMQKLKQQGISHATFGDIFLEDLKIYREKQMKKAGLEPHFPIWKKETRRLIKQFIDDGFKAVVVCAKSEKLDRSFAGRRIDYNFLNDLPEDVDPCGENGEFHTFVYDGPIFSSSIAFKKGELIYREYDAPKPDEQNDGHPVKNNLQKMGFWFCDLIPEK